jgi:hypothetical protein
MRKGESKVSGYRLVLFGASGFALGGLPMRTVRIASKEDSGYKSSLRIGLIPAVSRRLWAVLYGIPSWSAISCMVNPVIVTCLLSETSLRKISKVSIFNE